MRSTMFRFFSSREALWLGAIVFICQPALSQWVRQTSGTPEKLVDVVMLDSMRAVVIGNRNGILFTTNAGSTWTNENAAISATYQWNSISFCDQFNGAIVGEHRVVTTTDGGASWTLRNAPSSQKCLSVLCLSGGYIYVGADSGWMYGTSDTGKTWVATKISAWAVRSVFEYRGPVIVGGPIYYALTPHSLCFKPVYPSPEWSEVVLSSFMGLGSEAIDAEFCDGGGACFIVGVFGDLWAEPAILRKAMSDTAWNPVTLTPLLPGAFNGLSAPSSEIIYVCGSSGMIYRSSDGGDRWTSSYALTNHTLNSVCFWNENRGFAVGDSGTILYTQNGGFTSVQGNSERLPLKFTLEQNYPNPFNPETEISYQLSVNGFVRVMVCDLLGREVATLVNENQLVGSHMVRWNAKNVPSGVYICRLSAGGSQLAKKMLLLK